MNAREFLDALNAGCCSVENLYRHMDLVKSALRLLAAAESNDGTTPETDSARLSIEERVRFAKGYGVLYELVPAYKMREVERERNGLAAALEELARLKAPVEGEIAEVVQELEAISATQSGRVLLDKAASIIESLAAKVALLEDDITMWRAEATRRGNEALATASEEITKRERAEAALAYVRKTLDEVRPGMDTGAPIEAIVREVVAALAESERKCERLRFHAEALRDRLASEYTRGPCVDQSVGSALPSEIYAYDAEFKEDKP